MHTEILNKNQLALLPVVSKFQKEYVMAGGTAIALHLGHRLSIDFDLFKTGSIKPKNILSKFDTINEKYHITLNLPGQLNLMCRDVKFTFLDYEFKIPKAEKILDSIYIPSLLDLAAMKAYALGRRSKWKDYVDLYFILKNHFSIAEISAKATALYGELFSEKLFRGQLNYFVGISFEEQVQFMPGFEVADEQVKDFLKAISLEEF